MELKQRLYSIEETAGLLSLPIEEVHRLVKDYDLRMRPAITAESISEFAAQKHIEIKQESAKAEK